MDESWRMRIGMPSPVPPRRRSTTDNFNTTSSSSSFAYETAKDQLHHMKGPTTRRSTDSILGGGRKQHQLLDPDDFLDVFGGPPRTLLGGRTHNSSSSSSSPSEYSFYREIFRPPEKAGGGGGGSGGGRTLPAFRIPAARGEGFYDDVFGLNAAAETVEEGGQRSRDRSRPNSKPKSKPKSNSSSVLSSEEISPPRPQFSGDDVALSSFASKLRPINVPCRRNSTTVMPEEQPKKQEMPSFPCNPPSYSNNYNTEHEGIENFRSFYFKISRQVSSPETISLEPTSYTSIKASGDDLELNSPASVVSSLYQEPEVKAGMHCDTMPKEEIEREEDEVISSYVIEINYDHREGTGTAEAVSIDEAIAWAKERFQAQSSDIHSQKDHSVDVEERPSAQEFVKLEMDGQGRLRSPSMETELLDEDIKSWSNGKETNIRLLLSTLHHILWPNSGWFAVPLTSLIENSHVKKAYQRARLCLHPDKLQQRGATFPQKYVAEKAFPILQDAWAAFISQDVFFN